MKTCPRCKKEYDDYPATSRRDNKTNICSKCGTEEALFDIKIQMARKHYDNQVKEEREWLKNGK